MGDLGLQLHRPAVRLEVESKLFEGFTAGETEHVLACLSALPRDFKRGEVLLEQGEENPSLGIVLKGTVLATVGNADAEQLVAFGNAGDFYGGELLLGESSKASYSITAATPGSAAVLDLNALRQPDGHVCDLRGRLAENLSRLAGHRAQQIEEHRRTLEQHSPRERVAAFLSRQAEVHGSKKFLVTLNRTQLAEHLGIDRNALGRELTAMKEEGLVDFYRSSFKILKGLDAK